MNNSNEIIIPRAKRFSEKHEINPNISYSDPSKLSDFYCPPRYGPRGYKFCQGRKVDFSIPCKSNPGPGQYHLPSIWDKYWNFIHFLSCYCDSIIKPNFIGWVKNGNSAAGQSAKNGLCDGHLLSPFASLQNVPFTFTRVSLFQLMNQVSVNFWFGGEHEVVCGTINWN